MLSYVTGTDYHREKIETWEQTQYADVSRLNTSAVFNLAVVFNSLCSPLSLPPRYTLESR